MPKYANLTKEAAAALHTQLLAEYESAKSEKLNLNMTRGVP